MSVRLFFYGSIFLLSNLFVFPIASVMETRELFQKAIEAFDRANSEDPNWESLNGEKIPREVLYARRMTRQLEKFAPDAAEEVQLAARSQHIKRWSIARSEFPDGRAGYHKWRTALGKYHAEEAGKILLELGYEPTRVERVQTLLQKKGIKRDSDIQLLEDVVCLVFLEHYFADFARKHAEPAIIDILQKTWGKMSEAGHRAALELELSAEARALVEKALA